jgi:hypothetical protein
MTRKLLALAIASAAAVALAQTQPPARPQNQVRDSQPNVTRQRATYQPAVPPPTTNVYGGGGWGGYGGGGTTPAGSAMSGMSQVISAAGEYNLATSAAAINMTQAESNAMQNQVQGVNTFWEMRNIGKAQRAAERGPNLTAEQIARMARDGAPRTLTPSQMDPVSGRLDWPGPLQQPGFEAERNTLDELFAKRANYGGLTYADQSKIRETIDNMFDELKAQVRDIPPQDYVAARSFLRSLTYTGSRTDL